MLKKINDYCQTIFNYPKLSCLIGGIFATMALPPYYHLWGLLIGLSLLALLLNRATTYRQAFAYGYSFGFSFFAFGLAWICNALAFDLASFGWLIPITLIASGAFLGLFIALPAMLAHCGRGLVARCLFLAAGWTIFEWLRSFLFTGFPWNLLGSVWAFDYRFLQSTAIIGTYGLTALTVIIFSIPTAIFIRPHLRNGLIALTADLLLVAGLLGFGIWRTNQIDNDNLSEISVRVVQPSISQSLKWDFGSLEQNFADYIEMSNTEGFEHQKVVIWGETASTFSLSLDRSRFYQILSAIPDNGYLITGSIDYALENDDVWRPINAGIIFKSEKGIVDSYAKSHLVPFGEYIPFRRYLPSQLRTITKTISDFKVGSGVRTIHQNDLPPLGILICYEIIFPHQVADNNDRPQWLINLTNDGWYGLSAGPYQHLVATQLRAVEEGLTVVRAANSGISALISRDGKILASLALHQRGNLDFVLPTDLAVETVYSRYGNLMPLVLVLLLIAIGTLAGKGLSFKIK